MLNFATRITSFKGAVTTSEVCKQISPKIENRGLQKTEKMVFSLLLFCIYVKIRLTTFIIVSQKFDQTSVHAIGSSSDFSIF